MAGTEKEDGYYDQAKELYYSDVKFKKVFRLVKMFWKE